MTEAEKIRRLASLIVNSFPNEHNRILINTKKLCELFSVYGVSYSELTYYVIDHKESFSLFGISVSDSYLVYYNNKVVLIESI